MAEKTEIYLVTTEFQGARMDLDAFESQEDAIEFAKAVNLAAGNENARIKPLNLFPKDK